MPRYAREELTKGKTAYRTREKALTNIREKLLTIWKEKVLTEGKEKVLTLRGKKCLTFAQDPADGAVVLNCAEPAASCVSAKATPGRARHAAVNAHATNAFKNMVDFFIVFLHSFLRAIYGLPVEVRSCVFEHFKHSVHAAVHASMRWASTQIRMVSTI